MSILKIFTGVDNQILRKKSSEIKKVDKKLKAFAKDLKETMLIADGLGLAAPQVGENIRMIAVSLNHGSKNEMVIAMVNPEIISHGSEVETKEEGCLSVPGKYLQVERWKEIVLQFKNLDGNTQILKLDGLNARVPQHEIDHLDGILFVDRVKEQATKRAS